MSEAVMSVPNSRGGRHFGKKVASHDSLPHDGKGGKKRLRTSMNVEWRNPERAVILFLPIFG